MTYGFKVLNTSGLIVVDDTYSNYQVIAEGTANMGSRIYFPTQDVIPLVMVKPPNGFKMFTTGVRNGYFDLGWPVQPGSTPIKYKVMARASVLNPSGARYGIRVRNAYNQLVYDSGYAGLAVVGTIEHEKRSYWGSVLDPARPIWYPFNVPYDGHGEVYFSLNLLLALASRNNGDGTFGIFGTTAYIASEYLVYHGGDYLTTDRGYPNPNQYPLAYGHYDGRRNLIVGRF